VGAKEQEIEKIQRIAVRVVATNPAGHNLLLIGGFRYRLLDRSARFSKDIDYHWEGSLKEKQTELLQLCRRVVVPLTRRELGYQGSAELASGPETESPNVRVVELRFWKPRTADSQIVVPIEITRILCLDRMTVRTAEGTVYPTPSDADLVEGKIIATLNRTFMEHRDLVDLFLYGDRLAADSPQRLKIKLKKINVTGASLRVRLKDLEQSADYHARAVQAVIDAQLDGVIAAQLNAAGGGQMVFGRVLRLIQSQVQP